MTGVNVFIDINCHEYTCFNTLYIKECRMNLSMLSVQMLESAFLVLVVEVRQFAVFGQIVASL